MIPRLTLLTFVLGSNLLSAASYRFSLEGRDFDPKILPVLGTRKGDYTLGDIGRVGNFPFVLHAPGHYQFHFGNKGKAKLGEDGNVYDQSGSPWVGGVPSTLVWKRVWKRVWELVGKRV